MRELLHPVWFENIIIFFIAYILICEAILYYLGWRIYRWWNNLKDKKR